MSRCFCAYFCFCLYGLILFSSTVTSIPINNLLNEEENQDYVADATKDMKGQDAVQLTATLEPSLAENELEGPTNIPPKSELGDAVKSTGNTTVIIVFVAFALTMIVKGIPVVVAYSLPYFSKSSKTVDLESPSTPSESKSESDDDIKKEKCNDKSSETESSEEIKSKMNVSEETLCDTLYPNEKTDNNNTDTGTDPDTDTNEDSQDTITNESEKSTQEINPSSQVQYNNTKF